MFVDEIEAERPPVTEGSREHPICDECAAHVPDHAVKVKAEHRGGTCCWCWLYDSNGADSRGKYVEAPHDAVHKVWIH